MATAMNVWERLWARPQSLWVRKALFQVHLWTGIGLGLYVLLMSVSGSALIYRRELTVRFARQPNIVAGPSDVRMTEEELKQAALRAYPGYDVVRVSFRKNPALPAEVLLESGGQKLPRLFNPYTGADMGPILTPGFRFITWLADLHDNLLLGKKGRLINATGGIFTTLLCITGFLIWWPGIEDWRKSLGAQWKANRKGLNWTLHSALGFWSILFVLMWAITGIYLSIPVSFNNLVDYLEPLQKGSTNIRMGDQILFYAAQLHFGRFGGWSMKLSWTIIGIAPAVLFVTGVVMWWRRVLKPWLAKGVRTPQEVPQREISPRNNSIRA
jgi:uncharacterized iron-regulated membrane protein